MRGFNWDPPFKRYCRVKGTRCNRIMEMIEQGMTDRQISDKYGGALFGADVQTIRVYRKALEGKLTRGHVMTRAEVEAMERELRRNESNE